jgi:16S rRNA (guanine966-N2)-methyltransferase
MRVIAGEHGGRRLLTPPGRGTRPTSDRVREAAFSMLDSMGVVDGAEVWDLFAGSGAMGIEALSRGASHVVFVEQAPGALSATRANLSRLGYGPRRATVVGVEVLSWVSSQVAALHSGRGVREPPEGRAAGEEWGAVHQGAVRQGEVSQRQPKVDLVMADPPYAWQGWPPLLGDLAPFEPLVLAETGEELVLPEGWRALRSKRYGGTVVTLASSHEADGALMASSKDDERASAAKGPGPIGPASSGLVPTKPAESKG